MISLCLDRVVIRLFGCVGEVWGQRRSVPDLFALPAGVIRCCLRLLSSLGYSPRARVLEFCRVTGAVAVGDTVADNAADAAFCHGADGP